MRSSASPRASWGAVLLATPILLMAALSIDPARAADPAVRAVLFFSPNCPHCHVVIEDHMPGWFEANGGEPRLFYDESLAPNGVAFYLITNGILEILLVDVTIQAGSSLFQVATGALDIDSNGVPRLVAGREVMIGSVQIPERFPAIVSDAIAAGGGLDWPAIPGVEAAVEATGGAVPATTTTMPATVTTALPTTTTTSSVSVLPVLTDRSLWDRFGQDVLGNMISVVVLLAMLTALLLAARQWSDAPEYRQRPGWVVPLLALVGMAVALYMARVEIGGGEAVCGPVGDCNAVQQSPWARLFGVIPVGVVGVIGYGLVLVAWSVARFARRPTADWAVLALLAGGLIGVLLSLYLTFLEPFVIGATCLWCITSAIVVTLLMLLVVGDARNAADRLGLRRP